ncbi:unnamed protein product [Didymodactylos carnosus]|uniref:Uncharacterized protein n=1 Tax=Didymodactylos carnosus TaxID=1234261 RepID=A0A8S2DXG9_9BILA|nr:unnamed protein product [Didymodactylos carnosus]CAF3801759.1 unnamed protein product [Didymodactylos carnosus]
MVIDNGGYEENLLNELVIIDSDVFRDARFLLRYTQKNTFDTYGQEATRLHLDFDYESQQFHIDSCLFHYIYNMLDNPTLTNANITSKVQLPCNYCELKQIAKQCYHSTTQTCSVMCYDSITNTHKKINQNIIDSLSLHTCIKRNAKCFEQNGLPLSSTSPVPIRKMSAIDKRNLLHINARSVYLDQHPCSPATLPPICRNGGVCYPQEDLLYKCDYDGCGGTNQSCQNDAKCIDGKCQCFPSYTGYHSTDFNLTIITGAKTEKDKTRLLLLIIAGVSTSLFGLLGSIFYYLWKAGKFTKSEPKQLDIRISDTTWPSSKDHSTEDNDKRSPDIPESPEISNMPKKLSRELSSSRIVRTAQHFDEFD